MLVQRPLDRVQQLAAARAVARAVRPVDVVGGVRRLAVRVGRGIQDQLMLVEDVVGVLDMAVEFCLSSLRFANYSRSLEKSCWMLPAIWRSQRPETARAQLP